MGIEDDKYLISTTKLYYKKGGINMLEQYNDVISVDQVCEILHIGRNTVYTLLKTNRIRNIRVGNKYIIPKRSIIDFLNAA